MFQGKSCNCNLCVFVFFLGGPWLWLHRGFGELSRLSRQSNHPYEKDNWQLVTNISSCHSMFLMFEFTIRRLQGLGQFDCNSGRLPQLKMKHFLLTSSKERKSINSWLFNVNHKHENQMGLLNTRYTSKSAVEQRFWNWHKGWSGQKKARSHVGKKYLFLSKALTCGDQFRSCVSYTTSFEAYCCKHEKKGCSDMWGACCITQGQIIRFGILSLVVNTLLASPTLVSCFQIILVFCTSCCTWAASWVGGTP